MKSMSTLRCVASDVARASGNVSAPACVRCGVISHCSKIAALVAVWEVSSKTSSAETSPHPGSLRKRCGLDIDLRPDEVSVNALIGPQIRT